MSINKSINKSIHKQLLKETHHPKTESSSDLLHAAIITPRIDSQVKPKKQIAPRRSFSPAYKTQILAAYDACEDSVTRGALLRREGLYHARIAAWRHQQASGKNKLSATQKNATRMDHLIRENEQLKKKMAQAQAVIDLQKKVSDLLGMHILLPENNDEK